MLKAIGFLLIAVSLLSLAVLAFSPGLGSVTFSGGEIAVQGPEQMSPADRIDSSQIAVTANGVLIKGVTNVRLVNLADTNSMDPALDAESTAIEIIPEHADELHVGDIVSYRSGSNTIIHRIVEISADDDGWYAVAKGDNNAVADPEKVRFEQVKGVVVGILY